MQTLTVHTEIKKNILTSLGRTWSVAFAAATLLTLGLALWFTWFYPMRAILNVVPDDAFYYFQVARNISLGHESPSME